MSRAGIVEFDGENALPLPQLKFSPDDIEEDAGRKKYGLAVAMTVYGLVRIHVDGTNIEVVVHVPRRSGSDAFECFFDISKKERLGFLEDNCHGGVHGLNIDDAALDAVFFDNGGDLFGDVDEVERCVGAQADDVIDDFHSGQNMITAIG